MDKDNTARLLRIILLFGSALITVGIVAYVDYLNMTKELFWKLVFIVMVLPLTVPLVIFAFRFALLYQSDRFKPVQNTVNIARKQIKQLNIPIGDSSFEEKVSNDNRSINDNRSVNISTQTGSIAKDITNQTIENIVTQYFKDEGWYALHPNNSTLISAIRMKILEKTGVNVTKNRLLECLTSSHNYQTLGDEIVNKAEYEANKKDIRDSQRKYLKETAKEPWNRWKFDEPEKELING